MTHTGTHARTHAHTHSLARSHARTHARTHALQSPLHTGNWSPCSGKSMAVQVPEVLDQEVPEEEQPAWLAARGGQQQGGLWAALLPDQPGGGGGGGWWLSGCLPVTGCGSLCGLLLSIKPRGLLHWFCGWICVCVSGGYISRVPYQRGVSQAWYIVEIRHSGGKPSICCGVYKLVCVCVRLTCFWWNLASYLPIVCKLFTLQNANTHTCTHTCFTCSHTHTHTHTTPHPTSSSSYFFLRLMHQSLATVHN